MDEQVLNRFWSKVFKTDSCWIWVAGKRGKTGYGAFRHKDKIKDAHRFSYELFNGEINNSKLFVCHKCDNRGCVNPEHLYLGTAKDNVRDMILAGNMFDINSIDRPKGDRHWNSILTEDQIVMMRDEYKQYKLSGLKIKDLYDKYKISKTTFHALIRGDARVS